MIPVNYNGSKTWHEQEYKPYNDTGFEGEEDLLCEWCRKKNEEYEEKTLMH